MIFGVGSCGLGQIQTSYATTDGGEDGAVLTGGVASDFILWSCGGLRRRTKVIFSLLFFCSLGGRAALWLPECALLGTGEARLPPPAEATPTRLGGDLGPGRGSTLALLLRCAWLCWGPVLVGAPVRCSPSVESLWSSERILKFVGHVGTLEFA